MSNHESAAVDRFRNPTLAARQVYSQSTTAAKQQKREVFNPLISRYSESLKQILSFFFFLAQEVEKQKFDRNIGVEKV